MHGNTCAKYERASKYLRTARVEETTKTPDTGPAALAVTKGLQRQFRYCLSWYGKQLFY